MAPELVHRMLACLCPDALAALAAAAKPLADAARSPGPLWASWLDSFFGVQSVPEQADGCSQSSTFQRLLTREAARWSHPAAAEGVEPPAREFAAVAEIPGAEPPALLVHGGHCQRAGGARAHAVWTGDLWRLELPREGGARRAAWRALAAGGVGPGIRAVHDACVLGGRHFVVHGGLKPEGYRDNDTFVLDLHARPLRWLEVSPGGVHSPRRPTARFHHTFTPLLDRERVVIFGGHDRRIAPITGVAVLRLPPSPLGEAADPAWDLVPTQHDARLAGPGPRARHSAAPLGRSGLAVFGGSGPGLQNILNDLWAFDAVEACWEQLRPGPGPAPAGRQYHSSCVTAAGVLVLLGGVGRGGRVGHGRRIEDDPPYWTLDLSSLLAEPAQPGDSSRLLPPWQPGAPGSYLHPGLLLASLCEVQGHLIVFGGHTLESAERFDHFGDPATFSDQTLPADSCDIGALQGFVSAASPAHSQLRRSWRPLCSRTCMPDTPLETEPLSTFTASAAAVLGKELVVLAARGSPSSSTTLPPLAALLLRPSGLGGAEAARSRAG